MSDELEDALKRARAALVEARRALDEAQARPRVTALAIEVTQTEQAAVELEARAEAAEGENQPLREREAALLEKLR